jgi:transposase
MLSAAVWSAHSAELSEAAWARIESLMPRAVGRARPGRDHRQVVEGIVYRYRTGVAWCDFPERFALWQRAWKRHHRFWIDGLAELQAPNETVRRFTSLGFSTAGMLCGRRRGRR